MHPRLNLRYVVFVFFGVSLCAPPSQPGVRSFCFCAHPRLNLGCVLVFLLVCLCAHLRLNLGCVVFFFVRISVSTWGACCFCFSFACPCAHLRLNLGCVVFVFLCASPSQPGCVVARMCNMMCHNTCGTLRTNCSGMYRHVCESTGREKNGRSSAEVPSTFRLLSVYFPSTFRLLSAEVPPKFR